jgi:hypothetical protein
MPPRGFDPVEYGTRAKSTAGAAVLGARRAADGRRTLDRRRTSERSRAASVVARRPHDSVRNRHARCGRFLPFIIVAAFREGRIRAMVSRPESARIELRMLTSDELTKLAKELIEREFDGRHA